MLSWRPNGYEVTGKEKKRTPLVNNKFPVFYSMVKLFTADTHHSLVSGSEAARPPDEAVPAHSF